MLRATLDTNIYVSALVFQGAPRQLIDLAIDGEVDVAISEPILEETVRVLGVKFGWSREELDMVKDLIMSFARMVTPVQTLNVIKEDPADNRVVECAIESQSEYIVTGDKDLHRLGTYGGSRVVNVKEMLDILEDRSWRN